MMIPTGCAVPMTRTLHPLAGTRMGRLSHIGHLVFQRIQAAAIRRRANLFFIVSENMRSRKRSGVSISGTPNSFTSRILYNIFRKYVCTALNRPCNEIIPAQVPKTGISVSRHPFAKIDSIKATGFSVNYIVYFLFSCETGIPIWNDRSLSVVFIRLQHLLQGLLPDR